MDVAVRFTLEGGGGEANTAEGIARLVARLLREEGLVVGERGIGVRGSRSRTAHADPAEGSMKGSADALPLIEISPRLGTVV